MTQAQLKIVPAVDTTEGEEVITDDVSTQSDNTTMHLSWSAIQFIKAPPIRAFQWTVFLILAGLATAVGIASFTFTDVTIETYGEVASDMGVRDALTPSDGLVTRIYKHQGESVQEGEIIAEMQTDDLNQQEIDTIKETLNSLTQKIASAKRGTQLDLDTISIPTQHINNAVALQNLAAVEQSLHAYSDQQKYTVTGLKNELTPTLTRIQLLKAKIAQMKASKKRNLLMMYIEASEDELGKLEAQAATLQNAASSKLEQASADLLRSLRVASGSLDYFVKQHQIKAPITGTIAKLYLGANTFVSANKMVATIIPQGASFVAVLKVDSKNIPRVKVGQSALFRVEAYPYQRFGVFTGEVISFDEIKNTESTTDEFAVRTSIRPPASLPVEVQKSLRLLGGMKVAAHIRTDRKPVSQIIIERIFKH